MHRRSGQYIVGVMKQLPAPFARWFEKRGWTPHPHQLAMLEAARDGEHTLLIAPTGGGKTLAGFLPAMTELATSSAGEKPPSLHTLYISPLKALAVDIHRNLETPIAELDLPIRAESRTGDTPHSKRERQRRQPPHILLTTPESLALLLSYEDAENLFTGLRFVVVDEIHALAGTKRGDLMSLGLARLSQIAPFSLRIGLSATVAWPDQLRAWLSPDANGRSVRLIEGIGGCEPDVHILTTENDIPWSGHMAVHALPEVYNEIRRAETTLVFVNTRAQAEIVFQELWRLNDDNLAIALHHGSLAVEQRRKVEAAIAAGRLRAVVATSSLDLGVDWAAVDLVVQVGAPKGASRLIQRIGRAGHRLDTPSRAVLVPANRFEFLECQAALDAVHDQSLDGDPPRIGGLDVLSQHLLGMACSEAFDADDMYAEVTKAAPYADLPRRDFYDTLGFVENGGYALGNYERYHRLKRTSDGRYRIASAKATQRYRMNIGTIVESVMMKVRLRRGRVLGEVEEHFIINLEPGDTFVFSGQLLCFESIRETTAIVTRASGDAPKVPAYQGGRLPLSTHLADRVRTMLARPERWRDMPGAVREWLGLQQWRSVLPGNEGLLVEAFPRGGKEFLVAYCFEGRNAHQTLGMLLTRRMERAGLGPLGFVATDYVLAVWSVEAATDIAQLFDEDMLGDDLEAWMDESSMLKRTFRNVAVIAGLIERRYPGEQKTRRQVTFNSDLIYDVLHAHEPDHVLLRATRTDAAHGLTDVQRLAQMLGRVKGRISHRKLDRVSPLAVPVLLEIGKEQVYGLGVDQLFDEAARELIEEVMAEPAVAELPL